MEQKKRTENTTPKFGISRWLENAFIVAIILGALSFFWSSYFSFRANILNTYEKLAVDVEHVIFMDENLFFFCDNYHNQNSNTTCLNCGCLKDIEIFRVKKEMVNQIAKIAEDLRLLGKFLSYENYRSIHELTFWNNAFLSSDKGMCSSGLLVNSYKMDKWRNQLLNTIEAERLDQKDIFYSLKNYLLYIFTDIEEERYDSFEVDIKKLPIYTKENNNQPT